MELTKFDIKGEPYIAIPELEFLRKDSEYEAMKELLKTLPSDTAKHIGIALRGRKLPDDVQDILEDIIDNAEANKIMAAINAGEMKVFPAELVSALIDGGNPVRLYRQHRGLKAKTLAELAGITPAYLSEIETGKKQGSIDKLKALAAALDVDLDDLV